MCAADQHCSDTGDIPCMTVLAEVDVDVIVMPTYVR